MEQFIGVYLNHVQNGGLSKSDNWWTWQAAVFARDVVETFPKRHYFSGKYVPVLYGTPVYVSTDTKSF